VALFHSNHKNLAATGTALDVASLGKARAAMAKQTGLDGKTVLNIRPAFLVVPSSLELTAEQLIAQNLVPATSANVVPQSMRALSVIAEPRLDPASGAIPWYLFASPSAIDTIEYAYLEGQDGVFIETRNGFASTSTASRSRRASTSAPRRSTGAECTRIREIARNPSPDRDRERGGFVLPLLVCRFGDACDELYGRETSARLSWLLRRPVRKCLEHEDARWKI
jgi:hypothetical protein